MLVKFIISKFYVFNELSLVVIFKFLILIQTHLPINTTPFYSFEFENILFLPC